MTTIVTLLFTIREEFEIVTALAMFILSNAFTVLALKAVGLSLDFWVALILTFFVVGANAGFLALVANCAKGARCFHVPSTSSLSRPSPGWPHCPIGSLQYA